MPLLSDPTTLIRARVPAQTRTRTHSAMAVFLAAPASRACATRRVLARSASATATRARAAPRVAARREVRSSSSASARGTADLLGFGFARAASAGRVARSSAAETSGDAETSGVVLLDPPPAPAPAPAPAAAPAATTTTPPVDASQTSLRRVARHVHREAEYVFVRFSLLATGAFVLIGVCASLALSALLFSMGVKEVLYEAVGAWMQFSPVGLGAFYLTLVPIRPRRRGERRSLRTFPGVSLRPGSLAFNTRPRRLSTITDAFQLHPDVARIVTAAVGALDRFLLGMVCLVFGLGSFELFLARSSRKEEQQLAKRVNKPLWLRVRSIDDLEHKVGEIIVAVMVVNLLEMSLHMTYSKPVDLVWAALAALASAGALALLHWSSENHCGKDDDAPCAVH